MNFGQFLVPLPDKLINTESNLSHRTNLSLSANSCIPKINPKDKIIVIFINQHAQEGGALYVLACMEPFNISVPVSQTGHADTFLPVVIKYISLQLFWSIYGFLFKPMKFVTGFDCFFLIPVGKKTEVTDSDKSSGNNMK